MTGDRPPLARQLTFMAGCMVRVPFHEQVAVAAAAGFDSITTWPNIWRHAQRKEGLSLADMRALLDDHGLVLTDCDPCSDWVPPPSGPRLGPPSNTGRHEFFEVCSALGGTTIVAVHQTDAGLVLDRDIAALAGLCDDAAEHGLRIALEPVAFLDVHDVTTAWSMVEATGRPNIGLVVDVAHHARSGRGQAALIEIPPERIFTVQLCDGPAVGPDDRAGLADEAMFHRLLPGQGELDVAGVVRVLDQMGVRTSVGPELNTPYETRPPADLAEELMAATLAVLAAGTS